jgi:hypothetical protein
MQPIALRRPLLPLLLALSAMLAAAPAAHGAAVETVTNLDDAGAGSLRQAIADVDAGGTVAFDSGLSGTITLTSGQLDVGKGMTIDGPGAQELTVSGNDSSRILDVTGAGDVELSRLTLTRGRFVAPMFTEGHGGAVRKNGAGRLTIRDAQITDSTTSANGGYAAFGGALSVMLGDLTLERVTLAGNAADGPSGYGGGLTIHSNAGSATLRDVTIAGNGATVNGGGAHVRNTNTGAPVVMERVTVAGNTAPTGGGLTTAVATQLTGSIVAGNSASTLGPDCWTATSGSVVLGGANLIEDASGCTTSGTGTVVSGVDPRLAPLALNGPGATETMALGAGSPALDAAPAGAGACLPGASDQRGVARPQGTACDLGAYEARPASPRLDPGVADFGGTAPPYGRVGPASVRLHNDGDLPLQVDSISLTGADAGQFELGANDCATPVAPGAWCDTEVYWKPTRSGQHSASVAYESDAGDFDMTVTGRAFSAAETVTNLNDAGPGSLRRALEDLGPYGTVSFAEGLTGTIRLTSGEIRVRTMASIQGPGAQQLAISGNGSSRIFHFDRDVPRVTISGLTLRDGLAQPGDPAQAAFGGAIHKTGDGRLEIRDSRIVDSRVAVTSDRAALGGAIGLFNGELTLERVTLAGNRAESSAGTGQGGALYVGINADAFTLRDVTIAGNVAAGGVEGRGGGVHVGDLNTAPPMLLERTTIAGNEATSGAGLSTSEAGVRLADSIVADNDGADCATVAPVSLELRGANVIEAASGCTTSGSGTAITGLDPRLGPLALNGPGETETMALGVGSVALDAAPTAGDGACVAPATDQRGVARPQGSACDLGAFEARPAAVSLTPSAHDFGSRRAGSGASAPVALTLTNSAEEADLPLATGALALAGADAGQFALDASPCPAALAPGATCTLHAAFAPTRAGTFEATVAAGAALATLRGSGVVDPDQPQPPTPDPPVSPAPRPPVARAPMIERFALAQRCVRPGRDGRVRVGLALRLSQTASVRIEVARAIGTGGLKRCPPRGSTGTFGGRLAPPVTVKRGRAAAAGASGSTDARSARGAADAPATAQLATVATRTATIASVRDRQTVTLRLRPALYRITVRPYTSGRRLGRPVHRWLRVLAR